MINHGKINDIYGTSDNYHIMTIVGSIWLNIYTLQINCITTGVGIITIITYLRLQDTSGWSDYKEITLGNLPKNFNHGDFTF